MSVTAFLADLEQRGIRLVVDGDRLRCNAPAGVLTPALVADIQARKAGILDFLREAEAEARRPRALVPLRARGTRPPLFALPGHNGDVFTYKALVEHLGDDQPVYGLQPPGLDGHTEPLTRIDDLADYFAAQILAFRPTGACVVAGYCASGAIAIELARRLIARGVEVKFLVLFACPLPADYSRARLQWQRLLAHARRIAARPTWRARVAYAGEVRRNRAAAHAEEARDAGDPLVARRHALEQATLAAVRAYTPAPLACRAVLLMPNRQWLRAGVRPLRWRALVATTDEYFGPDNSSMDVMLREPDAAVFARYYREARDRQEAPSPSSSPLAAPRPVATTG